jgi:hypothetical protein
MEHNKQGGKWVHSRKLEKAEGGAVFSILYFFGMNCVNCDTSPSSFFVVPKKEGGR